MNWVGGIRNRVKLKQEKKLQKEFFERKRLQKKLNITNHVSVNASSSRSNGNSQSISQDLLALQVIMQTHDKPYGSNREVRRPTKVDLDRPNRHQPKFKNEEVLDLPLPSSAKPSALEFSEALGLDPLNQVFKPSTHPFHQVEAIENKTRKVDPDCYTSPPRQESLKLDENRKQHLDSFCQKPTKHYGISEACGSAKRFKPSRHSSHHKDAIDNMKRETNSYNLNTASTSSLTPKSIHFNENRNENMDSFYQEPRKYSAFVHGQEERTEDIMKRETNSYQLELNTAPTFSIAEESLKFNENVGMQNVDSFFQNQMRDHDGVKEKMNRKVDSFELHNFENVKLSRQEESFITDKRCSDVDGKGITDLRHSETKGGFIEKHHQTSRYSKIEQQSPFIPYAAPAPFSLAARTTTCVNHQDRYPHSQKSDYLVSRSTQPEVKQLNLQHVHDDSKLEETAEKYHAISETAEHKKVFLPGCIHSDKTCDNSEITNNNDFPLPSPATNEITIDCLNKSDPHSFLTDLQILEEIIPQGKHQPVKANPDAVMKMEPLLRKYTRKVDDAETKMDCTQSMAIVDEDNTRIDGDKSTDDAWRNFVTKRSDKMVNEDKKDTQNESHEAGDNVLLPTENHSPRRSRIAAEELKEVMAVQQYESSQESSYYSSWSSSASENEDDQKRSTSTSRKLPSNEVKETNTKATTKTTNSQGLPSTSTSDQLQNNSQNQVYTLGLSNGLKHLTKTKELPSRNLDQKGSNLSVYRIYPLSRSEDKGTQTLPTESPVTTVDHKSVQCEIWAFNPSTYPDIQQDNLGGDNRSPSDQDRKIETDTKQNVLKSYMGCFTGQGKTDKKAELCSSGEVFNNSRSDSGVPEKTCETHVPDKASNDQVPTPPIIVMPISCSVNVTELQPVTTTASDNIINHLVIESLEPKDAYQAKFPPLCSNSGTKEPVNPARYCLPMDSTCEEHRPIVQSSEMPNNDSISLQAGTTNKTLGKEGCDRMESHSNIHVNSTSSTPKDPLFPTQSTFSDGLQIESNPDFTSTAVSKDQINLLGIEPILGTKPDATSKAKHSPCMDSSSATVYSPQEKSSVAVMDNCEGPLPSFQDKNRAAMISNNDPLSSTHLDHTTTQNCSDPPPVNRSINGLVITSETNSSPSTFQDKNHAAIPSNKDHSPHKD